MSMKQKMAQTFKKVISEENNHIIIIIMRIIIIIISTDRISLGNRSHHKLTKWEQELLPLHKNILYNRL